MFCCGLYRLPVKDRCRTRRSSWPQGARGWFWSLCRQGPPRCRRTSGRGIVLSLLHGRRSHLRELGQTALDEVVRLRVHGKGMDLPRRRQAAHRFPHPRARSQGRKKDLDLFARRGIDRLQVHGNQQRDRRYLGSGAARGQRLAVPHPHQLPTSWLALRSERRADAQRLPQLAQGAQHRGLGKLAAQCLPGHGGGQCALLVERLPQLQHQRRDLVAGGFLRRMLPIRVRAQGKDEGQRLAVGDKIRLLAHRAQQVQGHHVARGNQACQQLLRLLDGSRPGRGMSAPHAGFDKGGRGHRQLDPAG
jgi:hypothetical protein